MNIFQKIALAGEASFYRLGNPSPNEGHRLARLNAMALLTGGKGFRTPAKEPRVVRDGKTRGELKREVRSRLFSNNIPA